MQIFTFAVVCYSVTQGGACHPWCLPSLLVNTSNYGLHTVLN